MEKHVIKNPAADIVGNSEIRAYSVSALAHSNPHRR